MQHDMMTRRNAFALSLVLALIVVFPGCVMAHNAGNLSIQQILERATNANPGGRGGGLLLIEAPGEPARTYVAGRRVRGGSAPVTPETPFGLASITKTMVAALALIYAERGLIDLDAPALEMVPDTDWLLRRIDRRAFRRNLEAATVRELLAHRSGLPDYWDNHAFHRAWRRDMARKWEPLDLVAYGGAMRPECAPGRCFEYSDTNFVIMGLLLEHRFGRPLHALLREEIFAPLGMRCTWMFFEEPAPASCPPVAHSYETRLDVTANRLQSADWAGGGLYSTLADQKRFLDALFVRRSLLGEAGMAALTDWQASGLGHGVSYGLGLYRIELGRGRTLVGHFGVHNAFSFVWVETGTVITGSLNQENNDASHSLLQPLLERLAARTERESVRE